MVILGSWSVGAYRILIYRVATILLEGFGQFQCYCGTVYEMGHCHIRFWTIVGTTPKQCGSHDSQLHTAKHIIYSRSIEINWRYGTVSFCEMFSSMCSI